MIPPFTAIILAAGKGTRMKSRRPKVLHELCGRSMLQHVLSVVRAAGATEVIVVVSRELREAVEAAETRVVVQEPQCGTGHAVKLAMGELDGARTPVLIVSADMPLLPSALLVEVVKARQRGDAQLALLTARVSLPTNFGRIIRESGRPRRIVEAVDASPQEALIDEVNAGVYCFEAQALRRSLNHLRPTNAQGELYLTDCLSALVEEGSRVETVECLDPRHIIGINNRVELATARRVMQYRILEKHMLAGVTIVDPKTAYIDADVTIEADTQVLPQTHLQASTKIGASCIIGPNTTLRDAVVADETEIAYSIVKDCTIEARVTVGPFAHLRGGAIVEAGAHIGNFVELKNTRMGRNAKAGHLAYLGDSTLGERVNIGAGTVTCNYDGKRKHKTTIEKDAFIGSNTSLVAPVEVGAGALTGAGAVVIHDVASGERVAGNPAKPLRKKNEAAESA